MRLRQRVEAYGLKIEAIENVPHHFYDLAMLGLEGADRQIANYQATVRHIGEAGIPILGYHWMPNGVWRTEPKVIRGGAVATAFDASTVSCDSPTHGRTFTADEMWDSYARFTTRCCLWPRPAACAWRCIPTIRPFLRWAAWPA